MYEVVLSSLLSAAPVGHTSASIIPLIKVGRGMYSVMHKDSGVTRFLVCQIYSVEGSKYIKIRSPFQVLPLLITFFIFYVFTQCILKLILTLSANILLIFSFYFLFYAI